MKNNVQADILWTDEMNLMSKKYGKVIIAKKGDENIYSIDIMEDEWWAVYTKKLEHEICFSIGGKEGNLFPAICATIYPEDFLSFFDNIIRLKEIGGIIINDKEAYIQYWETREKKYSQNPEKLSLWLIEKAKELKLLKYGQVPFNKNEKDLYSLMLV